MAVRFDATADGLARTTNLFSYNAAYTVAFWAYRVGTATDQYPFSIYNALDKFEAIIYSGSNINMEIASGGYSYAGGSVGWTVNTWYYLAIVRSSATAVALYYSTVAGALAQVGSTVTTNVASRTAQSRFEFGLNTAWDQDFSGRISAIKIWTVARTVAELNAEKWSITPKFYDSLYAWYPVFPNTTERARDYGPNGYHLTEAGTLTDEPGPPITWGLWTPPSAVIPAAAAGVGNPWYAHAQQ